MKRIFFLILFSYIYFISLATGHVQHYKNIKYLKYDLFLNNELIGSHVFNFKKKEDILSVKSTGSFKVRKLGIKLMDYKTESQEIYEKEQLIKFDSKTNQNDKSKYVNLRLNKIENSFEINGSSFQGKTESSLMIGSWWNHEIVKKNKQISAISGRIMKQKVKFLGKEKIKIDDKEYDALHFHFLSDDNKPADKKKLNIHVWYDSKTLLWVKSSYNKLGKWEYRLKKANF